MALQAPSVAFEAAKTWTSTASGVSCSINVVNGEG